MYARLVIFEVGPGKRSTIEKLVDEFDPLYRAQKGFRHMFVIGDEATGEYGSFSVWESKEDAKAANAVSAPQLQQAFTGLLQGPPNRWFSRCSNPRGTTTKKRAAGGTLLCIENLGRRRGLYTGPLNSDRLTASLIEVERGR